MADTEIDIPNAKPTNTLAIASFVSGLVWFGGLGSVAAVILGYKARDEMRRTGQPGEGLARAGIAFGWIGIGIMVLMLLFVLVSFVVAFRGAETSSAVETVSVPVHGTAALKAESALDDAAAAQASYFEKNGTYNSDIPATTRAGVKLTVIRAGENGYCIEARHDALSRPRHITESLRRPQVGRC